MGRPSSYDPEIAADICLAISIQTKGLEEICDSEDRFPTARTFYRWLLDREELRQLYARAKDEQKQILVDEIIPICDENPIAEIVGEGWTKTCVDTGAIQRNRLRVDTRKWLLSKLDPRKYGDKITHQGDSDQPLELVVRRIGPKGE